MVASGHGSDNVDGQCSSSDVSCGGTVGSSCGYLRDSSMPLLRVASGSDSPAIKKVMPGRPLDWVRIAARFYHYADDIGLKADICT